MKYKYGWDISEIENMMPWEKEVYAIMLKQEKDAEIEKLRNSR